MAEVLLFHHAHGLTEGVRNFADTLRGAGHVVHVPDLYDGQVFDDLKDGVDYASSVGFETIMERGQAASEGLGAELVYAGFSLGVMSAQSLAQNRSGAKGAVLMSACLPASEFGAGWPAGVPVQIHGMDGDEFFVDDGDIDAAREIVDSTDAAELFVYPGSGHLFADPSLPSYDEAAAALLMERVLRFLDACS